LALVALVAPCSGLVGCAHGGPRPGGEGVGDQPGPGDTPTPTVTAEAPAGPGDPAAPPVIASDPPGIASPALAEGLAALDQLGVLRCGER